MRKLNTIAAIVVSLLTVTIACNIAYASTTSKANTKPKVVPIQKWHTKNGVPVYFVHTSELPMIDIQLIFSAGSARDTESKAGLASLTNALLDEGTLKLTAQQIADGFEYLGAEYGSGVSRDSATLSLRSLTEQDKLQPAVSLLQQIINEPSFPANEFKRIQKQTLRAIEGRLESPRAIASDAFFEKLYQNNVYAKPSIGTKKTVASMQISDLQRFYHQYYQAKNCLIALVGDVNRKQAEKLAEQLVGHLPSGKEPVLYSVSKSMKPGEKFQNITFPAPQTTIIMGQIGIQRNDSRYFPLVVGNEALGGMPLSSRLFNEVRNKKGLSYYVHSGFHAMKTKGPFVIQLQTRNDQASDAIKTVKKTVNKFVEKGISNEELELVKKHLSGAFPLSIANNASILSNVVAIGFHDLSLNYLDNYVDNINAVSKEQVVHAMQQLVKPSDWLIITVGGQMQKDSQKQTSTIS